MKYLTQTIARQLDKELLKLFTLEQLMELAGLSVAQAIQDYHPTPCSVLIIVGNNILCKLNM